MRKSLLIALSIICSGLLYGQGKIEITPQLAEKLAKLPIHCIPCEYQYKGGHIVNNEQEALTLHKDFHPSFYGCFDWHSSVHSHWALIKLLKQDLLKNNADTVIALLESSFEPEKLRIEAEYFTKYERASMFERTYGWAWLLKLDSELATWDNQLAQKWHAALLPLSKQIAAEWHKYLKKQVYPSRTGLHNNSAFGMTFAIEWAKINGESEFEQELIAKAKEFFLNDKLIPAYLEPNPSDLFSPSLEAAALLSRILPEDQFVEWFDGYYDERSIAKLVERPVLSDLDDYQGIHLLGLTFARAWSMFQIIKSLPPQHPTSLIFEKAANDFINFATPFVFAGNYGGDHWIASYAIHAISESNF